MFCRNPSVRIITPKAGVLAETIISRYRRVSRSLSTRPLGNPLPHLGNKVAELLPLRYKRSRMIQNGIGSNTERI